MERVTKDSVKKYTVIRKLISDILHCDLNISDTIEKKRRNKIHVTLLPRKTVIS